MPVKLKRARIESEFAWENIAFLDTMFLDAGSYVEGKGLLIKSTDDLRQAWEANRSALMTLKDPREYKEKGNLSRQYAGCHEPGHFPGRRPRCWYRWDLLPLIDKGAVSPPEVVHKEPIVCRYTSALTGFKEGDVMGHDLIFESEPDYLKRVDMMNQQELDWLRFMPQPDADAIKSLSWFFAKYVTRHYELIAGLED